MDACQILRAIRPAASYVERVNRALDHVRAHLAEPLRLADVARVAGLSPFHFHRVFRAMLGVTLADFVKQRRLAHALGLMAQVPRPSLTAIAGACGFASSSDFSRSFRQRFGAPPSAFDLARWRARHAAELAALVGAAAPRARAPGAANPDRFTVRVRALPARTVAYVRVRDPYRGGGVVGAAARLVRWAERHGLADGPWLGYQWDNPHDVALADCHYDVAVEATGFTPRGDIGRYRFPPMVVAELALRGDIALELRALGWLYGTWLPRSGYVPDDQPCFEAWVGRPFAHGTEQFALALQLPIRRPRR